MRATIKLLHPSGAEVQFVVEQHDQVDQVLTQLLDRGYRPSLGEWPRGPSGAPLCLRHGVEMPERSKQGDSWRSHRVVEPRTGEELWCRGIRYGPPEKDGFLVEVSG